MYTCYISNTVSKHLAESGSLWHVDSETSQFGSAAKAWHQSRLHPWSRELALACSYGKDRKPRRQAKTRDK